MAHSHFVQTHSESLTHTDCSCVAVVSEHLGDNGDRCDEPWKEPRAAMSLRVASPLWRSAFSNTCVVADLAQTIMTVHVTVWLFFKDCGWSRRDKTPAPLIFFF